MYIFSHFPTEKYISYRKDGAASNLELLADVDLYDINSIKMILRED